MRKAAPTSQASLLRKSILQAAVQGKLVPQNASDEPARILLERIKAEKFKLVKEGKLKKEKPLPPITEDEKPFALPDEWEWVRLGDIAFKITDGAHHTPTYTFKGIPFLSVKDMSTGKLNFSNTKYISEKEHTELYKRCNPEKGDLLLTKVGTTGIPVVVDTDEEFSLFVSVALVKTNWNLFNIHYLSYAIQSPLVAQQAQENTRGVGNKNWVLRDIISTYLPLPPLAEQERIVAKVEELMLQCDQLEQVEQAALALDKHFFETLPKSILQAAVQGKLVPQDANDEPASELIKRIQAEKAKFIKEGKLKKEKALPPITEEEKPFGLPHGWEWVRLGDLGFAQTGNTPPTSDKENYGEEFVFVSPGDLTENSINYVKKLSDRGYSKSRQIQKDSIIMVCIGGSIGKCALIDRDIACNQQINTITLYGSEPKYVLSALRSSYFFEKLSELHGGTATPIVNKSAWCNIKIPLPPLAEQKRIVAKVEELMRVSNMSK